MIKAVEKVMDEYLVKKAPFQIPKNGKKGLAEWLPWIAIIFGVLQVFAALSFWRAGHAIDSTINYWGEVSRAYGVDLPTYELGPSYYIALIALGISAGLLLIAYPGLRDRNKKRGWDILLLSTLFNLAYGVFAAFTDGRYGGGFSTLLMSLISALIGLYLLAQVRELYTNGKKHSSTTEKPTTAKK